MLNDAGSDSNNDNALFVTNMSEIYPGGPASDLVDTDEIFTMIKDVLRLKFIPNHHVTRRKYLPP